jgi:hypothetical protein
MLLQAALQFGNPASGGSRSWNITANGVGLTGIVISGKFAVSSAVLARE